MGWPSERIIQAARSLSLTPDSVLEGHPGAHRVKPEITRLLPQLDVLSGKPRRLMYMGYVRDTCKNQSQEYC
jgi:hypothetical protein